MSLHHGVSLHVARVVETLCAAENESDAKYRGHTTEGTHSRRGHHVAFLRWSIFGRAAVNVRRRLMAEVLGLAGSWKRWEVADLVVLAARPSCNDRLRVPRVHLTLQVLHRVLLIDSLVAWATEQVQILAALISHLEAVADVGGLALVVSRIAVARDLVPVHDERERSSVWGHQSGDRPLQRLRAEWEGAAADLVL